MRAMTRHLLITCLSVFSAAGCAAPLPPIAPVSQVDIPRYMGDWYVIASIPTRQEKGAVNAIESYVLLPDGTIQTTFRFRHDSPDGALKIMHAKGYVRDGTNGAVWGMQFIWPIKAEYIIAWLDRDYRTVIVARNKRDYVWIMARSRTIPDGQYQVLVSRVAALGYDASQLRKVPQQ
ncbi:lipocalin family protein [Dyella sp. C11]|uniref:lipocalin family protein n=1 Tax=Dyella sp. C11 TaxID=2126991 RepID=UPI000D65EF39|nr:lipocalin family protein [Dyella sp. C11]